MKMRDYNLVYFLDGKTYINLTNRCTNNCVFCIRGIKDNVAGANLFLDNDNVKAQDVIEQLDAMKDKLSSEIIFCGYGEPMLKLEIIKEIAKYIKETYPKTVLRINTNGHANLIYKRNVLPELKGLIDKFSVSLNGENEKIYNELSNPSIKGAYNGVKDFIKEAVKEGYDTTATIVTGYKDYKINKEECIKITKNMGAKYRERPWLNNGY
ncbi:MAG: TatD family nuclease-associated radical SAM protein [Candidatus Gastranaerophilales bacterium]|nr:TatD family nuclease-associated radical SAM protein [Candidatus Gastranaerophilales bacterium]